MRHRKAGRKLKRTASHRRALLASLSTALIRHKRITTTLAKARETRMVVEKLITRARRALQQKDAPALGVHERRMVHRLIKDRTVIGELFSTVAERVASRNGGYTRIVKLGQRAGDGAELAVIELVDFNTGQDTGEKPAGGKKAKSPKSPASGKGKRAGGKEREAGAKSGGTKKSKERKGSETAPALPAAIRRASI
jgi:large subunit ribosomal protein L17